MENREAHSSECATDEEFIELLTKHKHQVFNFIFCILHSLSDAEDVFQQTSVALWQDFHQFRPNSDFGAWALKVARFRTLNFLRSKRRDRLCFSENLISQLAECPFEPNEVQDARLRALSECCQQLSSNDKTLVAMCYRGAAIRNVAVKIGRPVQAVYKKPGSNTADAVRVHRTKLAREGHS